MKTVSEKEAIRDFSGNQEIFEALRLHVNLLKHSRFPFVVPDDVIPWYEGMISRMRQDTYDVYAFAKEMGLFVIEDSDRVWKLGFEKEENRPGGWRHRICFGTGGEGREKCHDFLKELKTAKDRVMKVKVKGHSEMEFYFEQDNG